MNTTIYFGISFERYDGAAETQQHCGFAVVWVTSAILFSLEMQAAKQAALAVQKIFKNCWTNSLASKDIVDETDRKRDIERKREP